MAWLSSLLGGSSAAGAAEAGASTAIPAGGIGAGMSSPAFGAGMSTVGGGTILGPQGAAAAGGGMGPAVQAGAGQFGQGLGYGTFGLGNQPTTWPGQVGAQLGQDARRPQPMPQLPQAQQVGQQPLGNMFQRPSQGMDPQTLQQIGLMIMGMLR